jgi:phosphatidylglycerophosphate synthase
MQAVMVIPSKSAAMLTQKVAGVPLLVRVLATAVRAGVKDLILFWPADANPEIWDQCVSFRASQGLQIRKIQCLPFDPRKSSSWAAIISLLDDEFLWLPWNFVTTPRFLRAIKPSMVLPLSWEKPVRIRKDLINRSPRAGISTDPGVDGISVHASNDIARAERFLVANSGKATDGIYSTFNRMLSRPFVRILTHTRVTANMVTVAGLLVGITSALLYARGSYPAYVAGAILFFISGLIDEMDGMLARLKFMESAFGTWFEGFVDNATYLLLFAGITAGLYRQHGKAELLWGIALIVGCVLSVIVVALQRKTVTDPTRPHEYSARMNRWMERDSSLISRVARQIHIFIKKGVAIHYVLLFTVVGGLALFLQIAAISANLTWAAVYYFTRRLTRTHTTVTVPSAI